MAADFLFCYSGMFGIVVFYVSSLDLLLLILDVKCHIAII